MPSVGQTRQTLLQRRVRTTHTFGDRRHELRDETQRFLDLILRAMRQVLHDRHVCNTASQTLPTISITLLLKAIGSRWKDACQDLVQGIDDTSFKKNQSNLRASTGRSGESAEKEGERAGGDERRASGGKEQENDSLNKVGVNQRLKVLWRVTVVGINDANNAETSVFDESLV